jgi:hypothetical protein
LIDHGNGLKVFHEAGQIFQIAQIIVNLTHGKVDGQSFFKSHPFTVVQPFDYTGKNRFGSRRYCFHKNPCLARKRPYKSNGFPRGNAVLPFSDECTLHGVCPFLHDSGGSPVMSKFLNSGFASEVFGGESSKWR